MRLAGRLQWMGDLDRGDLAGDGELENEAAPG